MKTKMMTLALLFLTSVQGMMAWNGNGTVADPYYLSNNDDWNALAREVADGESFDGQYFMMVNNLQITTTIGTAEHPFSGHFDGNGKQLIIDGVKDTNHDYTAPFRYIKNATIRNMRVMGMIISGDFGSCLVGYTEGTNKIEAVHIDGGVMATGSRAAGFIGHAGSANNTIVGCYANAGFLHAFSMEKQIKLDYAGALVGWSGSSTLTVTDCLIMSKAQRDINRFSPIGFKAADSEMKVSASSHCFVYNTDSLNIPEGCHINVEYKQVVRIKAAEGINIQLDAATATQYGKSFAFSASAVQVGGVVYGMANEKVALTIKAASGYEGTEFNVAAPAMLVPTATGYELSGAFENMVINGNVTVTKMQGTGTQDDPYILVTQQQIEQLAKDVNNGETYQGVYFKLGADIEFSRNGMFNHTSIGSNYKGENGLVSNSFCGVFDGDGHSLIGVRTHSQNNGQGLFGHVGKDGVVKNVILVDGIFSGVSSCGAVVGSNDGVIENCHVTGKSRVNVPTGVAGGVAGQNNGLVKGCSSEAAVAGGDVFIGGIAGLNGNKGVIENCLYLGEEVVGKRSVGSICGMSAPKATLSHNYYMKSTVGGVNGSDITDNDGAMNGSNSQTAEEMLQARADFLDGGITTESSAAANAIGMWDNDGASATSGIAETVTPAQGQTVEWFTVDGQRLESRPSVKGIYVCTTTDTRGRSTTKKVMIR